jgi:hypothetical protein
LRVYHDREKEYLHKRGGERTPEPKIMRVIRHGETTSWRARGIHTHIVAPMEKERCWANYARARRVIYVLELSAVCTIGAACVFPWERERARAVNNPVTQT